MPTSPATAHLTTAPFAATATRAPSAAMSITLRPVVPADPSDAFALWELAALDSAPAVPPAPLLLAESDGRLLAALSLSDGTVIADPFQRTTEIVALMRRQADLLRSAAHPRRARRPRLGVLFGLRPHLGRP